MDRRGGAVAGGVTAAALGAVAYLALRRREPGPAVAGPSGAEGPTVVPQTAPTERPRETAAEPEPAPRRTLRRGASYQSPRRSGIG